MVQAAGPELAEGVKEVQGRPVVVLKRSPGLQIVDVVV